jgi:tripartite-type tricarboxylate transporter receptor subunit TctC
VLYAHPSLPAKDARELISLGKAGTHKLNFGSAGTGSMTHLTGELIKSLTKTEMLHIVYRGGTPAMNDLLAGHLPLQFATVAQALPQYKAGQLRALGISSASRYASVPEIATFKEQGIDVVTTEWYGLLAPAGTPRPIVDKLNAEMKRITGLPGMGDRLAAIELTHSTPEELGAFIKAETDRWGPVIKQLGLKGE